MLIVSIILALVAILFVILVSVAATREIKRIEKLLFDATFQKTELEKKNILLNSELEKMQLPNQTWLPPEVYNLLVRWCKEAGVKQVAAKLKTEQDGTKILVVYSDKPGYLIGKGGCIIDKYAKAIKSLKTSSNIQEVEIEEIYGIVNQFQIDIDKYYNSYMTGWFNCEEDEEEC